MGNRPLPDVAAPVGLRIPTGLPTQRIAAAESLRKTLVTAMSYIWSRVPQISLWTMWKWLALDRIQRKTHWMLNWETMITRQASMSTGTIRAACIMLG